MAKRKKEYVIIKRTNWIEYILMGCCMSLLLMIPFLNVAIVSDCIKRARDGVDTRTLKDDCSYDEEVEVRRE